MARDPLHERIAGNLMAAALGDALGTPTEGCSRAEITQRYGGLVRGFQPCAVEASAVGAVGLRPGEVTDDTSQLLAVARALIACDGELDAARWTAVLRDWLLTSPKARLAGPSTRRLPTAQREGTSVWMGRRRDGGCDERRRDAGGAGGLVCPGDVERAVGLA
jgi:ADP-ribosylglycohydrolase